MIRADGIEIRAASQGDLDQVFNLLSERFEPEDAQDAVLVAGDADEGVGCIGVAVDQGQIVATATLLRESVRIGPVELQAGQVELVATSESHERRGLVRDLVAWAHNASDERGDLLQLMTGIPFFYRQFGYSYCLPVSLPRPVAAAPSVGTGVSAREAAVGDIPAMARLQREVQDRYDLAAPHSAACWRWLVARDGSAQLVAEFNGGVIATARMIGPDDGEAILAEVAGSASGLEAIHQFAVDAGATEVSIVERDLADWASAYAARLKPVANAEGIRDWYSVRIPDPQRLLSALAPVFAERLAASSVSGFSGELLLSAWASHLVLSFEGGHLVEVVSGGVEQAPISKGGAGVPPDVLAPLLFSPLGAGAIEARHPDCFLGRQRELMETLFPPVASDLLSFYLPV